MSIYIQVPFTAYNISLSAQILCYSDLKLCLLLGVLLFDTLHVPCSLFTSGGYSSSLALDNVVIPLVGS